MTRLRLNQALFNLILAISFFNFLIPYGDCAKKSSSPGPVEPPVAESVIEEVNAKQLERILADKDYVAVFWCK